MRTNCITLIMQHNLTVEEEEKGGGEVEQLKYRVQGETDKYSLAKVSVWWDVENWAVPKGSAYLFRKLDYSGSVSISAHGDTRIISSSVQQALSSTGTSYGFNSLHVCYLLHFESPVSCKIMVARSINCCRLSQQEKYVWIWLETICVRFVGLWILLWPVAVILAVLLGILSILAFGCSVVVVAYEDMNGRLLTVNKAKYQSSF